MAKRKQKRPKTYDPKLTLTEGVEWSDLMKLSLEKPNVKKVKAKGKQSATRKK